MGEIKLFEEKTVRTDKTRIHPVTIVCILVAVIICLGSLVCVGVGAAINNLGIIDVGLILSLVGLITATAGCVLGRVPVTNTVLVPIKSQIPLLQDVHGGLDCPLCEIPERSLEPPKISEPETLKAELKEACHRLEWGLRGFKCHCYHCQAPMANGSHRSFQSSSLAPERYFLDYYKSMSSYYRRLGKHTQADYYYNMYWNALRAQQRV